MAVPQAGILQPVPRVARHLMFSLKPDCDHATTLRKAVRLVDGDSVVMGIGASLISVLGEEVEGMRDFPDYAQHGVAVPSTPFAIWCWLRGTDRGVLVHKTRELRKALADAFEITHVVDSFQYGASLDLSGYEDGTENPQDDEAVDAAITHGIGPGLDGSSFVAVQKWVHDLDHLQSMPPGEQDNVVGRSRHENEELDDAPESAHVKRTAQESFQPPAFIVRRSMPWADAAQEGLVFVAFGKSFDAFDAILQRMVGAEDGIVDALFRFTRPVTGSFFWCPPMKGGSLDLSAINI